MVKIIKEKIKKYLTWLAVFALILPFNVLSSSKVLAASANITKIVFTTQPQTLNTGAVSAAITVQTRNAADTSEKVDETTTLVLSTTSTTGEFSSSQSSWVPATSLTMSSGWSNRTFYYKDSAVGDYTLTVSALNKTWSPASQSITIQEGKVVNVTKHASYDSIQAAIDDSASNDVIKVKDGTYAEDISIPSSKTGLELTSYNGKAVTKIKGVSTEQQANFPDATNSTNIDIKADGTKIHGFTIESPDAADGYYSSGMVLTGKNVKVYDNNFIVKQAGLQPADNDSNTSVAVQTYSKTALSSSDINGLEIYNNTFSGTPAKGYYGVYINPTSDFSGQVKVYDNTFSGTIWRGVTTERSNTLISGNSLTTDTDLSLNWGNTGIRIVDWTSAQLSDITVADNTVSGNGGFDKGVELGAAGNTFSNVTVSGNSISKNEVGLLVNVDAGNVSVVQNSFLQNNTYGVQNLDSNQLKAENNYWGSANGPAHSSNPSGGGDAVSDNVDFSPWWTSSTGPSSAPPTVSLTPLGEINSSTPTFNWVLGGANPDPEVVIIIDSTETTLDPGTVSYTPSAALAEGEHSWQIKAVNAMGSDSSLPDTFTVDLTAPAAPTITYPQNGALSNSQELTIVGTAEAGSTVKIYDDSSLISSQTAAADGSFSANVSGLSEGSHSFYAVAVDRVGNLSSNSTVVHYTVNTAFSADGSTTEFPAGTENGKIDNSATMGVVLESVNTSGAVAISVAEYSQTPENSRFNAVGAFGKSFEITTTDDSAVTFPILLKLYYTQSDLDSAGITEDKLDGVYYFDSPSKSWIRYADSGVSTVSDIEGFAGYVWANADHFTPVTAVFDVIAPEKPSSLVATAGEAKVDLTWENVSDAQSYKVRYRKSTNVDDVAYTELTLSADYTSYTLEDLDGGVEYEFGVAALDRVGNVSEFAVVVATPQVRTSSAAVVSPSSSNETTTVTAELTNVEESTALKPPSQHLPSANQLSEGQKVEGAKKAEDDGSKKGKIAGEKTEASGSASKAAVTFAVLLLALAAGVGGYYGYEWWLRREVSKEGPIYQKKLKTAPKTKKAASKKKGRPRSKRSGKW